MSQPVYLALGDGITRGLGASTPEAAFTARTARCLTIGSSELEPKLDIEAYPQGVATLLPEANIDTPADPAPSPVTIVLAQPLWTVRHLLRACTRAPEALWQDANLLTLFIGGNDLRRHYYAVLTRQHADAVIHQALKQFAVDYNHLCAYLQPRLPAKRILITQYNPFPRWALATRAVHQLNAIIKAMAEYYGFALVDLEGPFTDRQSQLIAGYRTGGMEDLSLPFKRPLYPNDAGHALIAEAIRSQI